MTQSETLCQQSIQREGPPMAKTQWDGVTDSSFICCVMIEEKL